MTTNVVPLRPTDSRWAVSGEETSPAGPLPYRYSLRLLALALRAAFWRWYYRSPLVDEVRAQRTLITLCMAVLGVCFALGCLDAIGHIHHLAPISSREVTP